MEDRYHRVIDRLRISVTSRCDLKCSFCHAEGQGRSGDDLDLKEIGTLLEAAASLGVKTVKITGGEPLLREDIADVVAVAAGCMEDVSMTTNGTRLAELAPRLRRAGLSRVNVSLPSLDAETYRGITGGERLGRVLDGIDAAVACGLTPIKLNVVVLRGLNSDEVPRLMDFAAGRNAVLQLIELMTSPGVADGYHAAHHCDLAALEGELAGLALEAKSRQLHHRMIYSVPLPLNGGPAPPAAPSCRVEVVGPQGNPVFCANCTQMRVTADGRAKPCLMTGESVDLRPLIPQGPDAVKSGLEDAVRLRRPYWS